MINIRVVLRVAAALLIIVSLFMLTSVLWALHYEEEGTTLAFLIPALATMAVAGVVLVVTRGPFLSLSTRDGFLLVSLSWILATIVGAVPFTLSGAIPSYVDALFETMSGFTTTGASILTAIEPLPKSILFWRSLTHWLGGMGIIVLTVAIFPILGVGGLQLIRAEAPGPTVDKITAKITETAKILWLTYLALSAAETILLMVAGLDLFDALTHTFGTMATGGFSPKNASVGHYNSTFVDIVITVFMVSAGVNFVLYFKLLTGRFRTIARDTELKVYLAIFFVASLAVAVDLRGARFSHFGESLRYSSFQVASILTTTGYATDDFAVWPVFSQVVLFALMFVGGCSGSTGGGMKVIRITTMIKQGWNEMRYLVYPSAVFPIRINGERVRKNIVYAITGFVALYIFLLIVTTLMVGLAGNDIVTSFTTALVTLGNIGPGFGSIGPTLNYAFYPDWIKLFLVLIMMLGRLEVYTVLVLFTPRFWRQQ